jgi:hypothetical protein
MMVSGSRTIIASAAIGCTAGASAKWLRRRADERLQRRLLGRKCRLLAADLHFLQLPERAQAHVEDRLGLAIVERKSVHQNRLRRILLADDADHLVEIEIGDEITGEKLQPVGNDPQPVRTRLHQHVAAMIEPGLQQRPQPDHLRAVIRKQHVQIDRNPGLQVGQPEQAFHQLRRVDIARLRLQHQPDLGVALIAHIFQYGQLPVGDQRGHLLDETRFLHAPGDLADDDRKRAAPHLFLMPARAQPNPAAAAGIGLDQALARLDDDAAGRKIRPRHHRHQVRQIGGRIVEQQGGGLRDLGHIVRRNGGCHANRDAARAVGEQIGEGGGIDLRLLLLAIVGGAERHRLVIHAFHQQDGRARQLRLGIAHGSGVIAVDIAEIALPLHQRIAQREILREADERVIDRHIAMRVIFADHVAHHARAFLGRRAGVELELAHRPEQPPVHGLQPVAHVGQRPGGDRGQGIDEIALGQGRIEGRLHHAGPGALILLTLGRVGRGPVAAAHARGLKGRRRPPQGRAA